MMGRPGAPATKRNNAPNKSMAGFAFGCLVLEVGHMTVVEQGRGRGALGSHKVGAGQSRELRENSKQVPLDVPSTTTCNTLLQDALSTQEQLRETTEKRPLAAGAGGPLDLLSLIQALAPWDSLPRHNKIGAPLDRHATSSLFPNAVKMWRQGPLSIHQTLRLPSITVLSSCFPLPLQLRVLERFRQLWTPCCQRTDSTTTSRPVK